MNNIMNIINPFPFFWERVFSLMLLFCLSFGPTFGQHLELSPNLRKAYEEITQLEFSKGKIIIDQVKLQEPNNYLVYHIENYMDFLRCFIDEDEDYFDTIRKNKDIRLNKIRSASENSPYYKFSQAEILLQWAMVRLKFEEYATAILEINQAIKLLEENDILFPDFIENKKSLSALHALVGTIPDKYKNILSWISSFNGTIEQGYQEINQVYSQMDLRSNLFAKEVVMIKALIEIHLLNEKTRAYKTIQHEIMDAHSNPLICFIKANITHKSGHNDDAILMIHDFKPSASQHPLYYLDYLLGIYKLNRLDVDSDLFIRKYLSHFKGQNYIKEAYQKLAWYEWTIHNDSILYKQNMESCLTKGNDLIDEDKQAYSLAKAKKLPNKTLLKARLLNDGSYQEKALELLNKTERESRNISENIEYYYRRGRISHGLDRLSQAEKSYLKCLELPFDQTLYYQTAACLYLGQVYEQSNQKEAAMKYYKKCLNLNPDQYKSSLHQKAKAGLDRIHE